MLLIFGNDATFKVYGAQRPVLIESERGRGLIVPIRPTDTLKTKWNFPLLRNSFYLFLLILVF